MRCSVCDHQDRQKIEAAVSGGTPTRSIASQWGLSQSAVVRHTLRHPSMALAIVPPAAMVDGDDQVGGQLDALLRRLLVATDAVERNGSPSQVALLAKELRQTLVAIGAWRTELMKQAALTYRETAIDYATLPAAVEMRAKLLKALTPYPDARLAAAKVLDKEK